MSIPGGINSLLMAAEVTPTGARSLRFNAADSAYLSRTPSSAGNRKTWTWAGWVKRSGISGEQVLFSARTGPSTTRLRLFFRGQLDLAVDSGDGLELITSQVFRDPAAWLHVVLCVDTTAATAASRARLYVNGSQVTAFSSATYPVQNTDLAVNSTSNHHIGVELVNNNYFNGLLADIHFCDGTAYDASAFGEFDATTGVWVPKQFTGSYGTNGFQLKFEDNSSNTATTLGKDTSGNGNNWTPNNLSITAGAGNDSLVDVPTNGSEIDTGSGGQVRGNYCTWNPLANVGNTLSNGNLDGTTTSAGICKGTIAVSSGKWYWEVTVTSSSGGYSSIGFSEVSVAPSTSYLGSGSTWSYYQFNGQIYTNGSGTNYGASYTTGDVIGIALDLDNDQVTFYKNGTSQGVAATGLTGTYTPAFGNDQNGPSVSANFGARSFAYTAPSGFKALNTSSLPAPVITKPLTVMDVALWTGNGTSPRTISGLNFSPDLVWIKNRTTSGYWNVLFDVVRGGGQLSSNQTDAELAAGSNIAGYVSAYTSSGFTLSAGSSNINTVNENGSGIVGWCWDAGSTTVTNTQGSITSQVRANPTAGFSIVTYTGNGTNNSTVGHGLGVAPQFLIGMDRTGGNWQVWGANMNNGSFDCIMNLNTTAALATGITTRFRAASSTTFTIGTDGDINANGNTYVTYCFAPVAGYSAFGSYTGNGSADGPFVWTGMRPRWLLIKQSSGTNDWVLFDAAREPFNDGVRSALFPNLSSAESSDSFPVDILSNGFKPRNTGTGTNASGGTYIYAAFAESPFQYARAR